MANGLHPIPEACATCFFRGLKKLRIKSNGQTLPRRHPLQLQLLKWSEISFLKLIIQSHSPPSPYFHFTFLYLPPFHQISCRNEFKHFVNFFSFMTWSLLKPLRPSKKFQKDKKAFFEALAKLDQEAVLYLGEKISYDVRQGAKEAMLSPEDTEELLNDAILITVSNIKKGKFKYMDFSPATYAKGVARKLIANQKRKKKLPTSQIEHAHLTSDFNPDKYMADKERQQIVETLLGRLGENCRKLLVMKFYEQRDDHEIINQQMVPYSTIGSLKSKRSQCLKKMGKLAMAAGIERVF